MRVLLGPTQAEHASKIRELFFSPEARKLRNDPDISEAQELAYLDAAYAGWKNLQQRFGAKDVVVTGANGEVIREGKNELPGLTLVNDDKIELDPAEEVQLMIDQVDHQLRYGENPDAKASIFTDEDREWAKQAILKHIHSGTIGGDSIAALGTKGRVYPKGHELADQPIKAVWQPGQRQNRGLQILTDRAMLVDPDTGHGLHAIEIDALHREAAANAPELLTDVGNIRPGGASINRAVGNLTGQAYTDALKNRKRNLRDEQFFIENNVPAKQRGGIDKRTNRENLDYSKLQNSLDVLLTNVKNDEPAQRMAGQAIVLI